MFLNKLWLHIKLQIALKNRCNIDNDDDDEDIFRKKKQTFLEAKQVSGLFNRFSIQPLIGRHQKYLPRLSLH